MGILFLVLNCSKWCHATNVIFPVIFTLRFDDTASTVVEGVVAVGVVSSAADGADVVAVIAVGGAVDGRYFRHSWYYCRHCRFLF